jgi:hypothetical protein
MGRVTGRWQILDFPIGPGRGTIACAATISMISSRSTGRGSLWPASKEGGYGG